MCISLSIGSRQVSTELRRSFLSLRSAQKSSQHRSVLAHTMRYSPLSPSERRLASDLIALRRGLLYHSRSGESCLVYVLSSVSIHTFLRIVHVYKDSLLSGFHVRGLRMLFLTSAGFTYTYRAVEPVKRETCIRYSWPNIYMSLAMST